jgi:Ca2+/Na+ antiporter
MGHRPTEDIPFTLALKPATMSPANILFIVAGCIFLPDLANISKTSISIAVVTVGSSSPT